MQNHQADSPHYVWPDVWSADLHVLIKSMVIHDTECPYWDQVSLNNTNQPTFMQRSVYFEKLLCRGSLLSTLPFVWCQTIFELGYCHSSGYCKLLAVCRHQEDCPFYFRPEAWWCANVEYDLHSFAAGETTTIACSITPLPPWIYFTSENSIWRSAKPKPL